MSEHIKNVNARKEAASQKLGQLNLRLIKLMEDYETLQAEAWALGLDDIADAAGDKHMMLTMYFEDEEEVEDDEDN